MYMLGVFRAVKIIGVLLFLVVWPVTSWGGAYFSGAEVYAQSCAMCHAKGVSGAPGVGDIRARERVAVAGRADLLRSVLRGKGSMPPKGGNASLSVTDANNALEFMLSSTIR